LRKKKVLAYQSVLVYLELKIKGLARVAQRAPFFYLEREKGTLKYNIWLSLLIILIGAQCVSANFNAIPLYATRLNRPKNLNAVPKTANLLFTAHHNPASIYVMV
jgi:hypothetical protein